jgi:hypothetical protein
MYNTEAMPFFCIIMRCFTVELVNPAKTLVVKVGPNEQTRGDCRNRKGSKPALSFHVNQNGWLQ